MSQTSQETESSATDELKALLHEAEQALGNSAGEKFDELRGRLRSAVGNGKYSLEQIRAEAAHRAQQADKLVRENPYYAIGIAAGVGALVGMLVSGRGKSSR